MLEFRGAGLQQVSIVFLLSGQYNPLSYNLLHVFKET